MAIFPIKWRANEQQGEGWAPTRWYFNYRNLQNIFSKYISIFVKPIAQFWVIQLNLLIVDDVGWLGEGGRYCGIFLNQGLLIMPGLICHEQKLQYSHMRPLQLYCICIVFHIHIFDHSTGFLTSGFVNSQLSSVKVGLSSGYYKGWIW